ncbi:MAG: hypothetical protein NTY53_20160 [Kiritimatiellaeota bacterium]|nr:hypothetical protein [Kiritimatiellota bacterium]
MNEEPKKETVTNPLVQIAGCCAGASVGIVAIVFLLMAMGRMQMSDAAMWALAMVAIAPCAMGFGIAYLMIKQPRQEPPTTKT